MTTTEYTFEEHVCQVTDLDSRNKFPSYSYWNKMLTQEDVEIKAVNHAMEKDLEVQMFLSGNTPEVEYVGKTGAVLKVTYTKTKINIPGGTRETKVWDRVELSPRLDKYDFKRFAEHG